MTGGDSLDPPEQVEEDTISLDDERLYMVTIPAATGIQWGSDLTLRWPRVLGFDETSPARFSQQISVGDQLVAVNGESVVGATLEETVALFTQARFYSEVELALFKGSTEELQDMVTAAAAAVGKDVQLTSTQTTATVLVLEEGKPDRTVVVPVGSNLRDVLMDNGISPYRSIARVTNCSGKQLCGTCIVEIMDGLGNCSRRGIDEASTLRENPLDYRLSCVTDVYGNVTVKVQGKVGAAQWTR